MATPMKSAGKKLAAKWVHKTHAAPYHKFVIGGKLMIGSHRKLMCTSTNSTRI
jgi:hypothetical protein